MTAHLLPRLLLFALSDVVSCLRKGRLLFRLLFRFLLEGCLGGADLGQPAFATRQLER